MRTTERISTKKTWVHTDGWRGYEQPVYAVCGANNTGGWEDSPCPDNVCREEIKRAGQILRRNNIPYRAVACRTSNIFCLHVYLVVPPSFMKQARELLAPLESETELLYIV